MQVLLVTHHAPPHIGGVENLVQQEAFALAELGHEVVWVTSRARGAGTNPEFPAKVRVVRVPAWHVIESWTGIAYPLPSPALLPVLWREVGACTVLHAHGFVFLQSSLALLVAALRRKPSLLTDHGGVLRYRSWFAQLLMNTAAATLGRLSARLAGTRVAYNQRVLDLLNRLAGRTAGSVFLPNAVDRSVFHPVSAEQRNTLREKLGWSDARPRVLFVGRLLETKGIDLLLAAASPEFALVFCGPGQETFIERVRAAGATYLAPRPQADVAALYQAADLLALPSWNEGFPLVIQEALACGLKVVTADEPGYVPYHGLPGLFFCKLEPADIRTRILTALADDAPLDAESQRAWLPDRLERVERLYRDFLPEKSPGVSP